MRRGVCGVVRCGVVCVVWCGEAWCVEVIHLKYNIVCELYDTTSSFS